MSKLKNLIENQTEAAILFRTLRKKMVIDRETFIELFKKGWIKGTKIQGIYLPTSRFNIF